MTETEAYVIKQLDRYRFLSSRARILSTYSIGAGVLLTTICEDDRLQELHGKFHDQPSYMYLTKREQELEAVAHANLRRYPAGIAAQNREIKAIRVPSKEEDPQGRKDVLDLRRRIKRVYEARTGASADNGTIQSVVNRVAELQQVQAELRNIEIVFEEVRREKPEYELLLKLRYVERQPAGEVARRMNISKKTFDRYRDRAIDEFARLSGLTH